MNFTSRLFTAAFAGFVAVSATPASAHYYVPAPIGDCTDLEHLDSPLSAAENCLQVSGEVDWQAGYSTQDGVITLTDAHFQIAATTPSEFGSATSVLVLGQDQQFSWGDYGSWGVVGGFGVSEAYVSLGSKSKLMFGQKDSIAVTDGDNPFTFLDHVDEWDATKADNIGVGWTSNYFFGSPYYGAPDIHTGGHVIQATWAPNKSVNLGAGLENLEGEGTLVATGQLLTENLDGHITVVRAGILSGDGGIWGYHAAGTVNLGGGKVRAAIAGNSDGWWNGLLSGVADTPVGTLAATLQYTSNNDWEAALSVERAISNNAKIKVGFRNSAMSSDYFVTSFRELAAALDVNITEDLDLSFELGRFDVDWPSFPMAFGTSYIGYGRFTADWQPAGGVEIHLVAEGNSESAYKVTFDAVKSFQ